MKIIIIFIAFLVLASGIVFSQLYEGNKVGENQAVVLSENSEEVFPEKDQNEEIKDMEKNTLSDKMEAVNTVTPKPTSLPTPALDESFGLNDFTYPGSEIVSSSFNSLLLRTISDPDKVTAWYKEKIGSLNMSVKNFVTTKTNGNILNKLVGVKSGLEVGVEIKKEEGLSSSEVLVTLVVD